MNNNTSPDSKILFRIQEDDGSAHVETLWATSLGNDQYKLDNSPFFAYGVSWEDVVFAPFNKTEGFPTFQRIIAKSGNRTIRICFDIPAEPENSSDLILKSLVSLGCSYEGSNRKYFSINIPSNVDFESVRKYLINREIQWEHADPTYSQLFPDEI